MDQHVTRHYATMSRRRALSLGGTAAAGMAAAALVGCSSSNKPASSPNQPAGASAPSPAAASKPKPGGIIRYAVNKDPDNIDPNISAGATAYPLTNLVYSRLFSFEPGDRKEASGRIVPDLAQSFEQPDPLTLIVHLNPAAKFDQKEPLNGRVLNSEDVVQTWKRFVQKSFHRANLSNAANKAAPVDNIEAIDASTIRIKSKFVDSTLFTLLANSLPIQPVEGLSGKIDLSKEMRGTGPFLLEQYRNSISLSFKRNPNWFLGGGERPYADGVQVPIIPDQAQLDAQFRAKKLHFGAVSRNTIPTFAKELPGTEIAVGKTPPGSPFIGMSYAPGQPWHDVRVRRAVSMSLNRDTYADVLNNPKQFEPLGVKLTVRWNAPLSAGYGAYWLDPKGKDFGPAAAYLKHNVPEAVKMLAAAGFTSAKPLEFDGMFPGTYYNPDWPTRMETMQSMMKEAGVKMNLVSVDYASDYIGKIGQSRAQFQGRKTEAAMRLVPGGAGADPLLFLRNYYGSGGLTTGVGPKFPELDEMETKQNAVTKFEERVAGINDIQRWIIDNMAAIPIGPDTEQVDLVWSAIQGPQQYQPWLVGEQAGTSYNTYMLPNYWFKEQI